MASRVRLLLDMDCILADFIGGAARIHGYEPSFLIENHWPPGHYGMVQVIGRAAGYAEGEFTDRHFWEPINARPGFWFNLDPLPWYQEVFDLVTSFTEDWWIVTSPSRCRECVAEKHDWLNRWLGVAASDRMVPTGHKHLLANGHTVLLDDYEGNVRAFRNEGGTAVLFPAHHNALHQFKHDPVAYVRGQLTMTLAGLRKEGVTS